MSFLSIVLALLFIVGFFTVREFFVRKTENRNAATERALWEKKADSILDSLLPDAETLV